MTSDGECDTWAGGLDVTVDIRHAATQTYCVIAASCQLMLCHYALSRPSGQSGSYSGLIGFNTRRLKGTKRGMSSHAVDLSVYAKSSSSLCVGYNYDSNSIRRTFDCLSKVIKVAVVSGWMMLDAAAAAEGDA